MLFAVAGDERAQEIAKQPVRGLPLDGRGGMLAIVGGNSLRRRAPGGKWTTVTTSNSLVAGTIESAIEDFFPPQTLGTFLGGKTFRRNPPFD